MYLNEFADLFLLLAALSALMAALGAGAWLAERQARPAERPSPVWVFNNMPAGAIVDTERSVRESVRREFA